MVLQGLLTVDAAKKRKGILPQLLKAEVVQYVHAPFLEAHTKVLRLGLGHVNPSFEWPQE